MSFQVTQSSEEYGQTGQSNSFSFGAVRTAYASTSTTGSAASSATLKSFSSQASELNSATGKSLSGSGSNAKAGQIAQDLLKLLQGDVNENTSSLTVSTGNAVDSNISIKSLTQSSQSAAYLSEIELAILRSTEPIAINDQEEIEVNGQRGIWANRTEVNNWKSVLPITEYLINQDTNPEIITKRARQQLEYIQELAIRYLRPPTPPAPGEIIINQESNKLTPPAPPLIIRQQPARPDTPEPLVIREAPPQPPFQVGQKVITISGKRIPPPPRKVVVERLAPLPSKPQSILVERWLPYSQLKRRVVFNKSTEVDSVVLKPRNVIVQWEAPEVVVKKEFKYLGVIKANPAEYVQRYSTTLVQSGDLPQFVLDIKTPEGLVLAANYKRNSLYDLEGDVSALKMVDLDREGLGEYRAYLQRLNLSSERRASVSASIQGFSYEVSSNLNNPQSALSDLIEQIFMSIDRTQDGRISVEEAEKVILRLNSRLGRQYGEDDAKAFFKALDLNRDGSLSLDEFKNSFLNLLA